MSISMEGGVAGSALSRFLEICRSALADDEEHAKAIAKEACDFALQLAIPPAGGRPQKRIALISHVRRTRHKLAGHCVVPNGSLPANLPVCVLAQILGELGHGTSGLPSIEHQRDLASAACVNRRWHQVAVPLLWRQPLLLTPQSIISFCFALRLSSKFGSGNGSIVKRLSFPPLSSGEQNHLCMMSNLVTGAVPWCTSLRTLVLNSHGPAIDLVTLTALFTHCASLSALRLVVDLSQNSLNDGTETASDTSESFLDSLDSMNNQDDTGLEEESMGKSVISSEHLLVAGFQRLSILDLIKVVGTNCHEVSVFLAAVRMGLGPNLKRCHMGAFACLNDDSAVTLDDSIDVLQSISLQCPNLVALDFPVPQGTSDEYYHQLGNALRGISRSCPGIRCLQLSHHLIEMAHPDEEQHSEFRLIDIRSAAHTMILSFTHLEQIDIQGLHASEAIMRALTHYGPATLHCVLIDIDCCPSPAITNFITSRGRGLRTLSLLSSRTLPTYESLRAISKYCEHLEVLDLRHKPPDVAAPGSVEYPLVHEWYASLRDVLTHCLNLKRMLLAWTPTAGYTNDTLVLCDTFSNVVELCEFPTGGHGALTLTYPDWKTSSL